MRLVFQQTARCIWQRLFALAIRLRSTYSICKKSVKVNKNALIREKKF